MHTVTAHEDENNDNSRSDIINDEPDVDALRAAVQAANFSTRSPIKPPAPQNRDFDAHLANPTTFQTPPEYLNEDYPTNSYFLFPLAAQFGIPAAEIVGSLNRITKRYRFNAKRRKQLAENEKQQEAAEEELGGAPNIVTGKGFERMLQSNILDRKIKNKRWEALQMKAYGTTGTIAGSLRQQHDNRVDKLLRQQYMAEIGMNTHLLHQSYGATEFMKRRNQLESSGKTVFDLLTETQILKSEKIRKSKHKSRKQKKKRQQQEADAKDRGHTLVAETQGNAGGDSSDDDSDSTASVDVYTEPAVLRRLSMMPTISNDMRKNIVNSPRRAVFMNENSRLYALVAQRVHTMLVGFQYMKLLHHKFKIQLSVHNWSKNGRALILLQACARRYIVRRTHVKQQAALMTLIAFFKMGIYRRMRARHRSAINLVAQFIRDHSKRKQIHKVVRSFMKRVRCCQRVSRAFIRCKQSRTASVLRYATLKLGLNFDRYVILRQSMQTIFMDAILYLVSLRRKEFWKRKDEAKELLARGEGIFHSVRLEDARQLLKLGNSSVSNTDGGSSNDAAHALPPQVTGFGNGLSSISWRLFSHPKLDDLLRKYHQYAMDTAKSIAEQSHKVNAHQHLHQQQLHHLHHHSFSSPPSNSFQLQQQHSNTHVGFHCGPHAGAGYHHTHHMSIVSHHSPSHVDDGSSMLFGPGTMHGAFPHRKASMAGAPHGPHGPRASFSSPVHRPSISHNVHRQSVAYHGESSVYPAFPLAPQLPASTAVTPFAVSTPAVPPNDSAKSPRSVGFSDAVSAPSGAGATISVSQKASPAPATTATTAVSTSLSSQAKAMLTSDFSESTKFSPQRPSSARPTSAASASSSRSSRPSSANMSVTQRHYKLVSSMRAENDVGGLQFFEAIQNAEEFSKREKMERQKFAEFERQEKFRNKGKTQKIK
jgi:hypothetical protein